MSPSKTSKKILFQMTGSIACYKACQIISKLIQLGYEVQVVASSEALKFIGNATIEGLTGKPVISDLFSPGNVMDHIHLMRWADLILVAPATANFLNKAARGIGDDLITTQFLAHDFQKPFLIAPAMNTKMYLHPATQASLTLLRQMGIEILETASGVLACGEIGWGRLLEPDLIVQEIEKHLQLPKSSPLTGTRPSRREAPRILLTSGGTQEPIDRVRVLTNHSTGATGAKLADTLTEFGFDVTYLHAQNAVRPQLACQMKSFVQFQDLKESLESLLSTGNYSVVIHAAAVSDFSVAGISANGKIQASQTQRKMSSEEDLQIHLKRNPKLLHLLREMAHNPNLQIIAFKMTATPVQSERDQAVEKVFSQSRANLVVQNDLNEIDFQTGKHLFHVYQSLGQVTEIQNKSDLGLFLGEYLIKNWEKGELS